MLTYYVGFIELKLLCMLFLVECIGKGVKSLFLLRIVDSTVFSIFLKYCYGYFKGYFLDFFLSLIITSVKSKLLALSESTGCVFLWTDGNLTFML